MADPDKQSSSYFDKLPGMLPAYGRYILTFGVFFAVGLAPFLGTANVPGFRALLTLIPENLQDSAIPVSAFLMGAVAVLVQRQWYSLPSRAWLDRQFALAWKLAIGALLILVALYTFVIVPVEYTAEGKPSTIYIQVGFYRPQDEGRNKLCPAHFGDAQCLKRITLNRARIDGHWGDTNVRLAGLFLQMAYWATTSMLVWTVGLLIMRRRQEQGRK